MLMRVGGGEGNLCETIQAPFLLQVGYQSGVSAGLDDHIEPLETSNSTKLSPDRLWRLKFWQALPIAGRPEFTRDRFIGARVGAGTMQTGVNAGYFSTLEIRPGRDGIYHISFDSKQPMATEFKFWQDVPANFTVINTTKAREPQ